VNGERIFEKVSATHSLISARFSIKTYNTHSFYVY